MQNNMRCCNSHKTHVCIGLSNQWIQLFNMFHFKCLCRSERFPFANVDQFATEKHVKTVKNLL